MTKSELIASFIVAYPHLTLKVLDLIVTILFNQISAALARGDRVELRRFGAFTVRPREAHGAKPEERGKGPDRPPCLLSLSQAQSSLRPGKLA
jgi:integration host factor subunit beta